MFKAQSIIESVTDELLMLYKHRLNAGYDSPRLHCAGRPSLRLRRKEG